MPAVAPSTSLLSPFRGPRVDALRRAAAALIGVPAMAEAELVHRDAEVRLTSGPLRLVLGNVDPRARKEGLPLTIRLRGLRTSELRSVQDRLAPGSDQAVRMAVFAAALDAWLPFADLPDEEFRKVSSAPSGPYGTLRLGYRCNQDCWFCWQDRAAAAPPERWYWLWLDELAGLGIRALNITGGEATTWPILEPLIRKAAKDHGMHVSLQTNAIRLANADYLRALSGAGLQVVMASLHSADASVSDRMTRAPGTHRRTVEGIKQVLRSGMQLTLTCVVEEANVQGLVAHAEFIRDELLPEGPAGAIARVTYAHPTSYFGPGEWGRHQVSFDLVRPPLSRAVALLRAAGVPVQVGGPCGFPVCALDPVLVPDPYQVMEKSVFTEDELQHRRFGAVCGACVHRERCYGLRQEYLDRFGEDGLVPVRPAP